MKKLTATLITLALALSLTSCDRPPDGTDAPTDLPTAPTAPTRHESVIDATLAKAYLQEHFARFNIDGSTSMIPLHQSLNFQFGNIVGDPDEYENRVWHSRTVDAFGMFVEGQRDVLLGVDYSQELLDFAAKNGIDLGKREITREAFVFIVNADNPVQSLTVEQIKGIYSGQITNWQEVGGDNAPIQAFQRNPDSGSQMRMVMFMDDAPLMSQDVTYVSGMGDIIERVAAFDSGKYSIAYNMYTFTERQFENDNVSMLSVDGIAPTDQNIFVSAYPLVIYNYIWYDKNNADAAEFAANLHAYLLGEEGQKLISESGYVNLNTLHDRNLDFMRDDYHINWQLNRDSGRFGEDSFGFYNRITGEFYGIDYHKIDDDNWREELVVYDNYPDYVLSGSGDWYDGRFLNNAKAREFLMMIYNSEMRTRLFNGGTAHLSWREAYEDEWQSWEGMPWHISVFPWFTAVQEIEHCFNFRFNGQYFEHFRYFIEEDKFVLYATDKNNYDSIRGWEWADLDDYEEYMKNITPDAIVEITRADLPNLHLRVNWGTPIEYFTPFA